MKLYEDEDYLLGNYDFLKKDESILPDFFFVQSSSMNVKKEFLTVQGNYGQLPAQTKTNLQARIFNITGNVEAENSSKVEEMRASLVSQMFNKILWLKVYDDDNRAFKVILDGQISIGYNTGEKIGRVFTLSFTLKAFEGVSWNVEPTIEEFVFNIKENKKYFDIEYLGNVPVIPYYIGVDAYSLDSNNVENYESFRIKGAFYSPPFISCARRSLHFIKNVDIFRTLGIINGIPYSDYGEELQDLISEKSLVRPLILTPGYNKFRIQGITDCRGSYIKVSVHYRECFL